MLQLIEHVIFGFFFVEMLAKMLAMGVFGKNSYLAETWNRFDCFIVVIGLIEYIFVEEDLNISAIRAFRVLRPLRAITRIPSLRLLILLLLDTLPMLGNVLLFCCLVFFIFGIAGVQLLAGVLRNRCFFPMPTLGPNSSGAGYYANGSSGGGGGIEFDPITPRPVHFNQPPSFMPAYYRRPDNGDYICTPSYGVLHCSEIPLFEQHDSMCEDLFGQDTFESTLCLEWVSNYTECRPDGPNPHRGSLSFDHIGVAWMAIFQTISLEGWTQLMYLVQDAYSFWVWIYFVMLIVAGSFFAVNLCLVVIATQFSETKRREVSKMRMERKMEAERSSMSSGDEQDIEGGSFYTQVLDIIAQLLRALWYGVCCRHKRRTRSSRHSRSSHGDLEMRSSAAESARKSATDDPAAACLVSVGLQTDMSAYELANREQFPAGSYNNQQNVEIHRRQSAYQRSKSFCEKLVHEIEFNRAACRAILETEIAAGTIISVIILNSICMGVEHHGQPAILTDILDVTDRFFAVFFAIEVVVKIYAYGFTLFIRDSLNMLDLLTVVVNVVELLHGHGSKLSVLRTFRLLRVLKIVRFLPALQRQLYVMLRTIDNIATFFILLSFFLFISALLGMSLFGCRFCPYHFYADKILDDSTFTSPTTTFTTEEPTSPTTPTPPLRTGSPKNPYTVFPMTWPLSTRSENKTTGPIYLFDFKPGSQSFLDDMKNLTQYERDVLAYYTCPRANFDSLLSSLFTVLQVFTQDAWSAVLIDGVYYGSDAAGLYFITLVTIGNYVLFNLLVAILVEGFSNQGEDDSMNDSKSLNVPSPKHVPATTSSQSPQRSGDTEVESPPEPTPTHSGEKSTQGSPARVRLQNSLSNSFQLFKNRASYSLYVFSPDNCFRKGLHYVVSSSAFDNVILSFILANCLVIMVERPAIKRDSLERRLLDIANYVFNALFLVEAIVKIVANGLVFGRGTYLRSGWNILDFFLVNCSTIYTTLEFVSPKAAETKILEIFRVLRLLRALRPLRVVNRAPGLKIVVETLLLSIKPIGNVIIICLTFFLIFSILGVQLFQGCFYRCSADRKLKPTTSLIGNATTMSPRWMSTTPSSLPTRFSSDRAQLNVFSSLYMVKSREDCLEHGFEWVNEGYNFDNIFQALMTLFVFSTFDGWVDITRNGIDCVGVDMQPIRDNNPWNVVYFISFLLIVCFFILNMFVGVVVHNFQKVQQRVNAEVEAKRLRAKEEKLLRRLKEKSTKKKKLLTKLMDRRKAQEAKSQKDSHHHSNSTLADRNGRRRSALPESLSFLNEYSYCRLWTYHIFTHRYFELALAAITALNILVMAVEYYQMPRELQLAVRIIGYVFTGLLVLEVFAKVVAFGLRRYIAERWNRLDVCIVALSVAAIFFEDADTRIIPINPTMVRVARIVRIARVFKLLKTAGGIRRLLDTVGRALPQVGNLSLFFLLLFFIYASLGVELFGKFECNYNKCEGLSRHANFQNFGMTLLTLFRIFTGDDWNGILKDMLRLSGDLEECKQHINAANPGDSYVECTMAGVLAPFYFVSFVLLAQFVLINVVVAVLMSQLEESHRRDAIDKECLVQEENDVEAKVVAMEQMVETSCPDLILQLQHKLRTTKEDIIGIVSTEYILREEQVSVGQSWHDSPNPAAVGATVELMRSRQVLCRSDSMRTVCVDQQEGDEANAANDAANGAGGADGDGGEDSWPKRHRTRGVIHHESLRNVVEPKVRLRRISNSFMAVDTAALEQVFKDLGDELKPIDAADADVTKSSTAIIDEFVELYRQRSLNKKHRPHNKDWQADVHRNSQSCHGIDEIGTTTQI